MADHSGPSLHVVAPGSVETLRRDDWEAVYRREVDGIYRFIVARTGNREDAEDVCAQVFLRALPRLRSDASEGEMRAYLLTTARSLLADLWNQRSKLPIADVDEDLLPAALAHADADSGDHAARVATLLAALPERDRCVLELRFFRGYSIRETAAILGITVGNCKVVQLRALRRAAGLEDPR